MYMSLTEQNPYCEICPIIENPGPQEADCQIYDGEFWRVALRVGNQALLGTSFITLKDHKQSLRELSLEEDIEFVKIRNSLSDALEQTFDPDVLNISCLMNLAFNNPDDDPDFEPQTHVHWHVKPRYSQPRQIGGVIFTDPEFGKYLRTPRTEAVSPELGKLIASKVREAFTIDSD
jgi:diadenosine tetraphosphate (Ap4A) HIT family hydrolase